MAIIITRQRIIFYMHLIWTPILDKLFVPHQFDLVGIAIFEDASSDHVLKYFQIHYM